MKDPFTSKNWYRVKQSFPILHQKARNQVRNKWHATRKCQKWVNGNEKLICFVLEVKEKKSWENRRKKLVRRGNFSQCIYFRREFENVFWLFAPWKKLILFFQKKIYILIFKKTIKVLSLFKQIIPSKILGDNFKRQKIHDNFLVPINV